MIGVVTVDLPTLADGLSSSALDRFGLEDQSTVRSRLADQDFLSVLNALGELSSEAILEVPFFEDATFRIADLGVDEEVVSEWPDYPIREWSGTVVSNQDGAAGTVSIISVEDQLSLSVYLDDGRIFELVTPDERASDTLAVVETQQTEIKEDAPILDDPSRTRPDPESVTAASITYPIDVLIVTSDQLSNNVRRPTLERRARQIINDLNAAYSNTGLPGRAKFAGVGNTRFSQTGSPGDDLGSDGYRDHIDVREHERSGRGDLLVLMGRSGWGECGRAGISARYAIASDTHGCRSNFAGAHEVGHLQGAGHNPEARYSNGEYSYSHGHWSIRDNSPAYPFRTLMSYNTECSARNVACPRYRRFSNPDIRLGGVPTGARARDNGRTLENTWTRNTAHRFRKMYSDVSINQYWYLPVGWLRNFPGGATRACGTNRYCPGSNTNRALFIYMLWRSRGSPSGASEPFTDVDPNDWYYQAVRWAYQRGITTGCNPPQNTRFCPGRDVQRAEAAVMLWISNNRPAGGSEPFTDVDPGDWWYGPVRWLYRNDITSGCSPTRYCPTATIRRGDSAVFLFRNIYWWRRR
ncbi:MAG: hypothetical protein GEU79_15415 [Acidimicrobiia bacterium]|nr:hypothetical protein [Acidimicrobiia bacterium]